MLDVDIELLSDWNGAAVRALGVAEEFRDDWHVIAPDIRGHGDSAWSPEGHYGMDAFVYDFAQLIHTLGHEQVTIVAHSLGGNITSRFAGLYPDKVRKLVNIEGLGPSPEMRAQIEAEGMANRIRRWIEDRRKAAGRLPRRYPTIEAAYASKSGDAEAAEAYETLKDPVKRRLYDSLGHEDYVDRVKS